MVNALSKLKVSEQSKMHDGKIHGGLIHGGQIHGGDVECVASLYGIKKEHWIDLSTGLNPNPYPVNDIPAHVFSELPYLKAELIDAAEKYYRAEKPLALNGTQLAIQSLPSVLPKFDIIVPKLGYQEHALHWQKSGVKLQKYSATTATLASQEIDELLSTNKKQHLLIINPNNPSGLLFTPNQIRSWAKQLKTGCYVIVDEAFMDLTPQDSVLGQGMLHNIIVLRSFGKFFGLAGIRMGFVFAAKKIQDLLQEKMGLWTVNGPAQYLAIKALKDERWQKQARIGIKKTALTCKELFSPLFHSEKLNVLKTTHQGLFSSYWLNKHQAQLLYSHFAWRGILLRKIPVDENVELIRVGLMHLNAEFANDNAINRIKSAINEFLVNEV